MRFPTLSVAPTAADADGIFTDTQITATGNQTLNGALVSGGVVTLAAAQLITFTAGATDDVSGVTFTVTGTDPDGRAQTEAIVGPNNNTVTGVKYFKTITAVSASATTGVGVTVSCGNAITSVSPTRFPLTEREIFALGIGCVAGGTVTFTVDQSYDDVGKGQPHERTYPTNWFPHATIVNKSANTDGSILFPVTAVRVRVTASTSGSVTTGVVQAGV